MAQIILDSANNLIQGDFDAATVNNRTKLQTSTTNATTGVYVVPNGSATSASVQMANAADLTNASKIVVATNGATDTQIVSGANGSGSYLPLSFYTNNDIRFQMGNAGELNVRTAPGTVSSGTSGQLLTSGGPGAGVSWTTVSIPAGGQLQSQLFTSPGTWTKPASATQVRVTVIGGGGGGSTGTGNNGGSGGLAIATNVPVSAPVSVTVGSGGAPGNPAGVSGGTSSFGPAISATGGSGGGATPVWAASGGGTVSLGTAIKTGTFQDMSAFNNNPAPTNAAYTYGYVNVNGISGSLRSSSPGSYSTSGAVMAGAAGAGASASGLGGAVLVEFVG